MPNETRRVHPSIDFILPNLYLSNYTALFNSNILKNYNVYGVISLMMYPQPEWQLSPFVDHVKEHLWLPCEDSKDQDMLQYMNQCYDFIEKCRLNGKTVVVHCRMGISRSATIVAAYYMRKYQETYGEQKDVEGALFILNLRRECTNPNKNFVEQLEVWGKLSGHLYTDKQRKIPHPEYQKILDKIGPNGAETKTVASAQ